MAVLHIYKRLMDPVRNTLKFYFCGCMSSKCNGIIELASVNKLQRNSFMCLYMDSLNTADATVHSMLGLKEYNNLERLSQ